MQLHAVFPLWPFSLSAVQKKTEKYCLEMKAAYSCGGAASVPWFPSAAFLQSTALPESFPDLPPTSKHKM